MSSTKPRHVRLVGSVARESHEVVISQARERQTILSEQVDQAVTSLQNINPSVDREVLSLLTQSNELAHELYRASYKLKDILIKSSESNKATNLKNLNQVAVSLAESSSGLSGSLDKGFQEVKSRLAKVLQNVKNQVNVLAKEVESKDRDINEDIVEVIEVLSFSIEKVWLRNNLERSDRDSLLEKVEICRNNLIDNLVKVKDHPHVFGKFRRQLAIGIKYTFDGAEYISERASDVDDPDVEHVLLQASNDMNDTLAFLDQTLRSITKVRNAQDGNKVSCNTILDAIVDMINGLGEKAISDVEINNILLNGISHTLSTGNMLAKRYNKLIKAHGH